MHETNKNSISFSDSAIGKYEIMSSHLLSIWICLLKFLLFLTCMYFRQCSFLIDLIILSFI